MEGVLPLPLSLFHSLPFVRLLLLVFLISGLASYSCSAPPPCEVFRCGEYALDYPFGKKSSGCGYLALQLDCDEYQNMSLPVISIFETKYYILQPKTYTDTDRGSNLRMTILDKRLTEDKCDVSSPYFYEEFRYETETGFHFAEGYNNTILGIPCVNGDQCFEHIRCKDHSYCFLGSPSTSCESFHLPLNDPSRPQLDTLLEGVNITWNNSKSNKCEDCRNCDFPSFSCYCAGRSYSGKCSHGKSRYKIFLGLSIGGGLAVVVAVLALFLIFHLKRRKSSNNLQLCVLENSKSSRILKVEKFLQDYSHQMPTRFSYSQLKKITNNFADKLGEGGFGVVYKGMLRNGNLVAIKMIDQTRFSEIQFMNEVATIGRTHHVHLVRLMGYCFECFRTALVYEYMVNGSLDKFIFVEKGKQHILSWEQLYSIALGAARGIAYLHQDCERRIIHFDIKPHNVLLDAEFTAKVSDFGLAKLCGRGDDHVSITRARGTPGYVAPEIWCRNLGPVTEKSDVYSFGMLLLEIVGGRKNIDAHVSRPSEVYFPEWAFRMWEKGELETWLRGKGEMECEEEEKARRLTKIGLWCIQYSSRDRPSMSRVVQMLEGNGDDVSNPPFPFNSTLPAAPLLSSSEEYSSSMVQLHIP